MYVNKYAIRTLHASLSSLMHERKKEHYSLESYQQSIIFGLGNVISVHKRFNVTLYFIMLLIFSVHFNRIFCYINVAKCQEFIRYLKLCFI